MATRAESLLWHELRTLKPEGWKFRRQSPTGPYIVDFVCLGAKLVVEGDSHETPDGKRHDSNRDAYLNSLAYVVMRFDARDVLDHPWHAAQLVRERAARCRMDPTRPLRGHPPLKGEGNP